MSFSEDPTQGIEHGAAAGEDPAGSGAPDSTADPTQGAEVGEQPYEDPTQGAEVGESAYEDPDPGRRAGVGAGRGPDGAIDLSARRASQPGLNRSVPGRPDRDGVCCAERVRPRSLSRSSASRPKRRSSSC